ncbi:hypothetical protein QBC37DRAFT_446139 [Rhypophila decipiens]|uniref:Uncharacterized protein n=1 Tax=Rhypophila decipiens TaxID=261697 RepID=A0AAN6Y2J5_9PEZI|nr:hypothetical protein QBC37DRAFT_446139 [Rhypophila decipiens]
MDTKFIAIGIDFGTTYSGVSWAFSGSKPHRIHEIREWPTHRSYNGGEVQVPTQIHVESGKWGYQVTPDMDAIKWFKLLLLHDDDIDDDEIRNSPILQRARTQVSQAGMTPTWVVGMFLKRLWEHTYAQLKTIVPVDSMPLRVAITVPAIWPAHAQAAMREAAAIAGITKPRAIGKTRLDLVQEPEAAALSSLLERNDLSDMKEGESFVVCDAGGGTIDIISYKVLSTTPFRIGECVQGKGKLAGAIKVDEAFQTYLRAKTKWKFDSLVDDQEFIDLVAQKWEHEIKRAFTGGEEDPPNFFFPIPTRELPVFWRTKGKEIPISKADVKGFFFKSLSNIRSLLSWQVNKVKATTGQPPKHILLVGGLGSSRHIHRVLSTIFDPVLSGPGVFRTMQPWSAAAQGAVIRIFQDTGLLQSNVSGIPEVVTRKAKYSYGITAEIPIHRLSDFDQYLDTVNRDPEGNGFTSRMRWYLKKGDDIEKWSPVFHEFRTYAKESDENSCVISIKYSAADTPPSRPDQTVSELCRIQCEWDKGLEQWDQVGNPADGWRRHDNVALAMRYEGQLKWTVRVGKNATEHEVKVEYMN